MREEERRPYREAVRQLDTGKIGGILIIKTKPVSEMSLSDTQGPVPEPVAAEPPERRLRYTVLRLAALPRCAAQ